MASHSFIMEDLDAFVAQMEARGYVRVVSREDDQDWIVYYKTLSKALNKFYAFPAQRESVGPVQVRVTYKILNEAKPLLALAKQIKRMNEQYRKSLPVWKTKPAMSSGVRDRRWDQIQRWLGGHSELIECFKYQADDRLTEGNPSFNLMIPSTPREQRVCFEFIKALAEAFSPNGIVRGRRQADGTRAQRNGWIRRYAQMHRKRGWTPIEIAREIQKELRQGTWDERSRLQYNLANNTILKIAGLKISPSQSHSPLN